MKPITDNLPTKITAHAVRGLQICERCGGLGHRDHMVYGTHHTLCWKLAKGFKAVLALPSRERDKYRLCDLTIRQAQQLVALSH